MIALDIIAKLKTHNVAPKLVGDQLKLIGDVKSLPADVINLVRAHKEEVIVFLSETRENTMPIESIPGIEKQEYYPLSNAQKRIWVLSQFDGGNEAYNIVETFVLEGKIELDHFERSIQRSIQKHESLRTSFQLINDEPVQVISEDTTFSIEVADISFEHDFVAAVKRESRNFGRFTFDLESGTLLKIKLLKYSEERWAMMVNIHHIISDGWSTGVLVQEIMQSYKQSCEGNLKELQMPEVQYKEYVAWMNERINGTFGEQARNYWNSKSLDAVEPINLPIDYPRSDVNEFSGHQLKFTIDPDKYERMENFARQHNTTLFNFFRSVISISLHKWTNQEEIIIGTPVAGRSHRQLEDQIGLFVNTLPLASSLEKEQSYADFLTTMSQDSLEVFKYQDFPLDIIIEELGVNRDTSRNPLFDILMVVQNNAISDGSIELRKQHGFNMEYFEAYAKQQGQNDGVAPAAKFDLTFSFVNDPVLGFRLTIEYRDKLFKQETVEAFYRLFDYVTDQVMTNDTVSLADIRSVDGSETERILTSFNQAIETHSESNIVALMEANFSQLGVQTAVFDEETILSYEVLDKQSNAVANKVASLPGNKVGVMLSRSTAIVPVILGILKSGKAYVPIDIKYPDQRIQYIIDDAELEVIIADEKGKTVIPDSYEGMLLDTAQDERDHFESIKATSKTDTAYLIYTSGSTGKPKGVEITHGNAIAFLKWCAKEFNTTDFDTLYAGTSYCFDLSVFEMFFPLVIGKKIRIIESGVEIPNFIGRDKKVLINTVPSVVRNMLDMEMDWSNVAALNMAGEPVPKVYKELLDWKNMEVRNLYGPSEDTTYSTCYRFAEDRFNDIPIGVPVGDTHAYILNSEMQLQPVGVEGEICLSGESVAKGYYNRPTLSAEKFIENPFVPGKKLYRTGDIGKWTSTGQLMFIGRMDDQVKVRGFRIELGEIQYHLEEVEGLHQAVAVVKEVVDQPMILAYYSATGSVSEAMLKAHLQEKLPAYMIPSFFIELDEIPLNANGKVDKKQLPLPEMVATTEVVAPKNATQEQLLEIWQDVLGVNEMGITHNFFDLGGHSLKATRLKALIQRKFEKELSLNELFQHTTIETQAELLDTKGKKLESKIETIEQTEQHFALSFAQERLWVLTKFEDVSKAYHMPAAFEVSGELSVERLEQALNRTVARHESLRTVFREIDNTPYQCVLKPSEMQLSISEEQVAPTKELQELLAERWNQPFDLENGPLLRCELLHYGDRKVLSFNMHHLISDGWSLGVLFKDVISAYRDIDALDSLTIQYKDFAVWQRDQLSESVLSEQLDYWKNEVFAEGVTRLELPTDQLRPELKTYNGNTYHYTFPLELSKALMQQATEEGASLFMGLMANVKVLLKKLSNQNDIVVGTPVSGRENSQLQEQIGFYINALPIRCDISGKKAFKTLISEQREQLLSAFDYQHFPFEKLVEELQPTRDMSRSPLFDVMVVLQNFDHLTSNQSQRENGPEFSKLEFTSSHTKYDLTFSFTETDKGLQLELEYNTDLYAQTRIEKMVQQLERICTITTTEKEVFVEDISIVDEQEMQRLLSKADNTNVGYRKEETIVSRFQRMVQQYPDRVALKVGTTELTYEELDRRSGQLAAVLNEKYGVTQEQLIVLHMTRSEWMIVSILAILKAGAAYVPVDPQYPASRIQYILDDSGAKLLLTDIELSEEMNAMASSAEVMNVSTHGYTDATYSADIDAEHLAYIIYTSGTTGNPKGVLIEHEQVNRLLFNDQDVFDFNENDKWTLFHSYCFDFSVWEMYGALLKGGTLVMVPKEVAQDSTAFFEFLHDEQITVLNQTPTAFRSMVMTNTDKLKEIQQAVRYLIFGGEALMPETLSEWHAAYPECKIVNMYGITETTVHVTYKEITAKEIEENKSNIGVPIPTLSCYVLDNDLKPCAIDVIGELCVGGAGVARGYHNKPELTAERFVENPFEPETKIYRSGDFAKVLSNGDIEYIGRKDDQVKIRGHRIELAEVEAAVKALNGVKDAVVLTYKQASGEYELAAYLIETIAGSTGNYRTQLTDRVPGYMIPSQFIVLDDFPLTSNGKLDKKALPNPLESAAEVNEYVAPRNETDERVVEVWKEVLGHERIGIQDNFFDLGGHSLKATRVLSKIQEQFGVRIDLKNLFQDPTIENLSKYIDAVSWMNDSNEDVNSEEELIL